MSEDRFSDILPLTLGRGHVIVTSDVAASMLHGRQNQMGTFQTQVHTKIEIDALGADILDDAFAAADAVATDAGRSRGGFIRLCKVDGSGADPYVVAIRKVKTERKYQFSCGCRDWIFRRNKAGTLCKHQKAFLANAIQNPNMFWMYEAGVVFAQSVAEQLAPMVETAIAKHNADEKAA